MWKAVTKIFKGNSKEFLSEKSYDMYGGSVSKMIQ